MQTIINSLPLVVLNKMSTAIEKTELKGNSAIHSSSLEIDHMAFGQGYGTAMGLNECLCEV